MKSLLSFATASFLAFTLSAGAAPAPWYKWRSATGDTVCAQTSPGPGWFRLEASYVDARCQRRNNRTVDNARTKNRN
ncbi:MAG: hypothetical protein LBD06_00570 [Candidatus Accumulibacter sp.]|jgi:hypothetical protein|nr:hypothetical protein [Accumulibacter sp.]